MKICKEKQPEFFEADDGHKSACWLLHPDAPKAGRFAEKEVMVSGK